MTVAELIERLQALPPDLPVWHDGGGDPYCAGEVLEVEHLIEGQPRAGWVNGIYTGPTCVELG